VLLFTIYYKQEKKKKVLTTVKSFSCLKIAFSLSLSSLRSCHILFKNVMTFSMKLHLTSINFSFLQICISGSVSSFRVLVCRAERIIHALLCMLSSAGMFSFKRRLERNLNSTFRYLMGRSKDTEPDSSVLCSVSRPRTLKYRKLYLNIRKKQQPKKQNKTNN